MAAPTGFGRRSSPAARCSGSNPVGDASAGARARHSEDRSALLACGFGALERIRWGRLSAGARARHSEDRSSLLACGFGALERMPLGTPSRQDSQLCQAARPGRCPKSPPRMPRIERSSSSSGQWRPKGESSIRSSSASVTPSRRGFPTTGNASSRPLASITRIFPSLCEAETGLSPCEAAAMLRRQLSSTRPCRSTHARPTRKSRWTDAVARDGGRSPPPARAG